MTDAFSSRFNQGLVMEPSVSTAGLSAVIAPPWKKSLSNTTHPSNAVSEANSAVLPL